MKKQVLYAIANYEEIVQDHGYFVDKTPYIEKLETVKNPVFLRPRRFGKSLLCSMLRCYYDLNYQSHFAKLFGHTWIGQHPTGKQNQFIILSLDFSSLEIGSSITEIEHSFRRYCNGILAFLQHEYADVFSNDLPKIILDDAVSSNLANLLHYLRAYHLPPMYVIIDEYDNFANQLVTAHQDHVYCELTADNSFLKTFFKTLKEGRKTGAIADIFVTGVLPITIDDLASGYNIANFITLRPKFESMLGFTQAEVDKLLDEIYHDYEIDSGTRREVEAVIKNHYDGYHFVTVDGDPLYNSTLLMYFLHRFIDEQTIPKQLIDLNLKTDISMVKRLIASNPEHTKDFVEQLALHHKIGYDDTLLESFNQFQLFKKGSFPVLLFYLGMLTRQDDFYFKLPNLNMQQIFVEYFN
ncbi:MAG: AAA family ATPase [Pseudomonadota bacterium]